MAAAPSEDFVAEEQRLRVPVAMAAVVAGITAVIAGVLRFSIAEDQPQVQLISVINERFEKQPPVLEIRRALYYDDKGAKLIITGVLLLLAAATTAFVLSYIFKAIAARDPGARRVGIVMTIIGGVMVGIGGIVASVAQYAAAADFADKSKKTLDDAHDVVFGEPTYLIGQAMYTLGGFILGAAFVIVALNAMRVGLLTRFMGVLGVMAGVLTIVPFLSGGLPILQALWLAGFAALLVGSAPTQLPKAWAEGRAMPWPTQQEIREEREERARAQAPGRRLRLPTLPTRTVEPEPEPPKPEPKSEKPAHSSSKKRKRKRRS